MAKPDFQLQWGVNRVGGIPTTDPADYQLGWQYRAGLPPLTGNFDYYQNLADERLLYLNAQGIPEWDAVTAYDTDAYVKGSDGETYRSTAPTTGNDPTLGGPWTLAFADTLNTVRQDIASAATVVLPTTTRHVNITGTTAITAFTISAGNCYFVRLDAAATLTNNASIVTQTGSSIVATAGDTCIIRATATDVVEVLCYTRGLGGIGDGQLWQDVTGGRSSGVTYTNTTGKPISVSVSGDTSATPFSITVNGVLVGRHVDSGGVINEVQLTAIVPDGATYVVQVAAIINWSELR